MWLPTRQPAASAAVCFDGSMWTVFTNNCGACLQVVLFVEEWLELTGCLQVSVFYKSVCVNSVMSVCMYEHACMCVSAHAYI